LEKVRKYKLENEEKIKEYNYEKIKCPTCEKTISRHNMLRHQKMLHPTSDCDKLYAAKYAEDARQRTRAYLENNRELIQQKKTQNIYALTAIKS